MCSPMGGEFSTDFKSSNRIEISRLVQVLLNFYQFQGSPLGGGRWVDGGGGGYGCVGRCHMHTHMHTHACTCMLNMINMDASMSAAICNFYTCVYVHVHVCTCMYMCVVTPPPPHAPRHPPTHLPLPQSRREPKTPKFNKSN